VSSLLINWSSVVAVSCVRVAAFSSSSEVLFDIIFSMRAAV